MRVVLPLVNNLGKYIAAYPLIFFLKGEYIMSRQADTEQYISSVTDSGFTGLSLKFEVEGRNKK